MIRKKVFCPSPIKKTAGANRISSFFRIVAFHGYNPIELNSSTFGGRVYAWRCLNGVSTIELARRLCVDKNTIQEWEREKHLPIKGMLKRV